MKLDEYLRESGRSRQDFAKAAGLLKSTVSELCNGHLWPTRTVAEKIFIESGGKVTSHDFHDLTDLELRKKIDA